MFVKRNLKTFVYYRWIYLETQPKHYLKFAFKTTRPTIQEDMMLEGDELNFTMS